MHVLGENRARGNFIRGHENLCIALWQPYRLAAGIDDCRGHWLDLNSSILLRMERRYAQSRADDEQQAFHLPFSSNAEWRCVPYAGQANARAWGSGVT